MAARGPRKRGAPLPAPTLTGAPIFVGDKGGAVVDLLRVRRLIVDERVARFGMTGPGGQPRLTPVPFAMIDDDDAGVMACTLDVAPRSLGAAALLRSLASSPRVSFLIDHSERDQTRWWVQADGIAEVIRRSSSDPRFTLARMALADRYPDQHTEGPTSIVWTTVTRWNGWTAASDAAAAA